VTARVPAIAPGADRSGLLAKLMGAVGPRFRADVLVFAAQDPVFGGGVCRVGECPRSASGQGLCQGHHLRWVRAGRPDLQTFAQTTDPRWRRQRPNLACAVAACGYGSARGGLCQLHGQRWHRAGRPDLQAWLDCPPLVRQPGAGAVCMIAHCELWPHNLGPFCLTHAKTWKVNGSPDPADFAARFDRDQIPEDQVVRLEGVTPQLKLEVQYALQCRDEERATKTAPVVVMRVVRHLAASGVLSLLDREEDDWRTSIGRPAPKDCNPRALLVYMRRRVGDLAQSGGWEGEFPRDVWQLRRLGFEGNATLRFGPIPQPQLRDLVKRWVRWRLGTGLGLEAARRGLRALTRFALFCHQVDVTLLADVDRTVLERYLADLHTELAGRQRHGDHIGQLASFLQAVRVHRWDDTLPATALIFPEDYPKRSERPPRALAEHVMAQVEHPDNLDRWDNPAHRLATVILMNCGLRVTDALRLERECVVLDAGQAPYLRYFNHKMRREALVPIDEDLRDQITAQQRRVRPAPLLFPRPTKNPDGKAATSSSTYRLALYRWLASCQVNDERGHPVHLTPHQWRHTLGTRLINRDVPQEVVRRILDHDSPQMTAHYARLHDTTVRRHWEAARKVDHTGSTVHLDRDGPLAEAAWAKQRLGRATQALPNGYCGLPVQKSCPHANACLTCPMFITTPQFLPQHRQHHGEVLHIISAAQARGQTRLVEMNQQVADNLHRIITALEDDTDPTREISDAS
jgi:integrase